MRHDEVGAGDEVCAKCAEQVNAVGYVGAVDPDAVSDGNLVAGCCVVVGQVQDGADGVVGRGCVVLGDAEVSDGFGVARNGWILGELKI